MQKDGAKQGISFVPNELTSLVGLVRRDDAIDVSGSEQGYQYHARVTGYMPMVLASYLSDVFSAHPGWDVQLKGLNGKTSMRNAQGDRHAPNEML